MIYLISCALAFVAAYLVSLGYVTVFYHRGLTHGAVTLRPWAKKFVILTGNWITGLDPKSWACMHRNHHLHSDTPEDPHSPVNHGMFRVLSAQLASYGKTMSGLREGAKAYTSLVPDLDFPVNWLNRKGLWYLPHIAQGALMLLFGWLTGWWLMSLCIFAGMESHPIQGWAVNSFGHRFGYRNFETPDNSRNNTLVSWLILGEGYQNNHHERPASANFAFRWWEIDFGYVMCRIAQAMRFIDINRPSAA
jgi:stearoyl-CoA desaturase (Delta-9 desaturase)